MMDTKWRARDNHVLTVEQIDHQNDMVTLHGTLSECERPCSGFGFHDGKPWHINGTLDEIAQGRVGTWVRVDEPEPPTDEEVQAAIDSIMGANHATG